MSLSFDLRGAVLEVLKHDTGRPNSARDLFTYLLDLLYYGDFRIAEQAASLPSGDHTNLIGVRGAGDGGLLLCSADTGRRPLPWYEFDETEDDPLNPTLRDGLLFGHAAASPRVDLICKLAAATRVPQEDLVRPVVVTGLFGPDARIGGASYLIDSGIVAPQWALVGEGTDLELVGAHRGHLQLVLEIEPRTRPTETPPTRRLRMEVRGVPSHAANPRLGVNAIDRALTLIERLRAEGALFDVVRLVGGGPDARVPGQCVVHLDPRGEGDARRWTPVLNGTAVRSEREPSAAPPIDGALAHWRSLRGRIHELIRWSAPETAPDFVPDTPLQCVTHAESTPNGGLEVELDYRTLPGERTEQLIRDLEALIRRHCTSDYEVSISVQRNVLPFDAPDRSGLQEAAHACLREIGLFPVTATYAGHTEAWLFQAAGIDTRVFGPGSALGQAHRPNEHVPWAHVERATDFYERVIRRLCT